ncbi:MAG: serine/threonine protein kinase [Gammaproteobacteria bacterium HGW-Gammaproteobacteria-6]|jgi:serine/threonine-protein kinase|nr:MAG: serine/threonine protein kinase [Gammaproteobacteria bacterium HGW-Gammaproteobacteria-6]
MLETLGRYRIQGELGRGAMSIVYRAYDPHIKRVVAIKTLRPEYAEHKAYRQRFVAEARAVGTLTHPGIVTVFDVGETSGMPFIAMERVDGPSLDNFVRDQRSLPLRMILKMAVQIADALDYAHRQGIVHQDIKLENIICTSESGNVKIMDFGIAKRRSDASWKPDEQGYIAGTPHYMSPEALRGVEVDGRSDLYALGVMLYWLLAGRTPYQATDVSDLFRQILNEPLPPLLPQHPDAPEALLQVVRTLLQKDPRDRYQTGAELIEDLRQIDDVLATQEQTWEGRRIVPIRVRWTVVMSLLVAVTVAIGLGVVHNRQNKASTGLAFDYGFTLSRLIADQAAEDLLLEDHVALRAMVAAMARNRDIAFLQVSDASGVIVASTNDSLVESESLADSERSLLQTRDAQQVFSASNNAAGQIMLFKTPVSYQDHAIGSLRVGMSTAGLSAANRTTVTAMVVLMLITLVVVFAGAYTLSRRLMVPIELVRRALWKITQGHFDSRIRQHRDDEFERVFSAYNAMADSLEARMLSLHINPGSITGEYNTSTEVSPAGAVDALSTTHEIQPSVAQATDRRSQTAAPLYPDSAPGA